MFTDLKTSLCNSHNSIMYWSKEIKRSLKRKIKEDNKGTEYLTDVLETLDLITKEARIAKRKGMKMEGRLKAYRNAIEKLGFKRVSK